MHIVRTSLVVAFVALLSSAAWAQAPSVTGRVVDSQGAAVAGADVALTGGSRPARSIRSGADGTFTFQSVTPGVYQLIVQARGFASSTQTLNVGAQPAPVTATLQVAGITEDVTVQGALAGTAATGKTTLPVRELPMTVNAVPSEVIAEQGVNDLVSALQNVGGVYPFTTYGVYEYYSFRGFLDSVQLLDGVRNEGNRVNTQLTNIERVEVLKGPSSALYGGAALGATVNLIRKKPSAMPEYDFMGAAGSWQMGRGAFGASGRLGGGGALYRFDVGGEGRDGYRHDEAKRFTITPSLAWRIGGDNQLNIYYTFNRDSFGGDAGLPLTNFDFDVPVDDNVIPVPRDRNYRTPQDDATSRDQNLQVGYARQFSDAVGFRNTLSYRNFNDEYFLSEEVDFIPPATVDRYYLYFKHHRRPLMNLAEVTGRVRGPVEQNLVFGWESQRYHNYTTLPEEDFFSAESIDAFDPVETQGPSDLTPASQNVFTNITNAFYVQDHVTLGPQVKVLLGGRYDVYRRTSHSDSIDNGAVTEGTPAKRDAEAFTSRVGLVYQPSSVVDLYGSFATSFKPLTQAQPDGSSLDPETGSQVEFGQRFHMAGDRVQLNTSIYRIQRQNVSFRRTGGIFVQAGEVESRGFEADLMTAVTSSMRVNASYGFTDAQFNDYEESPGVNLRGNTPTFAPRHTFNIWTAFEMKNGLGFNVGARYFGETFADNGNVFAIDGYGTLNLGVRYKRGQFEYALNVNNVTDTKYFIAHQDYAQVYPGDPINVLGTVRVRLR
ncbi:MAG TPA: TonB-dependent receptor [Vicinamibacterales bacterium]|nr:TonB-dependent receptor [Vicinamibacterales bacterium]